MTPPDGGVFFIIEIILCSFEVPFVFTHFFINSGFTKIYDCAKISTISFGDYVKFIKWNAKAREFIRQLDTKTKREIGALLLLIQNGNSLSEPLSKPMKTIHQKAYELRVRDQVGNYRVIYVLSFNDVILIPHAFVKKSNKTTLKDINVTKRRLAEMLNENF